MMRPPMASRTTSIRLPLRSGAAAAAVVLASDLLVRLREWPRPIAGLFDETAHLATGVALLAASPRPVPRRHAAGVLAGSVLLDVDHVPEVFGKDLLRNGDSRPVPHSLPIPALLARDRRTRAVAVGVAAHLVRDLATGNGVQLLWPLTRRVYAIPYAAYAALLAGAAVLSARPVPSAPPPVAPSAASAPAPPLVLSRP
jgi:inner membrane protein